MDFISNITGADMLHFGAFVIIPFLFRYYATKISDYKNELDNKLEHITLLDNRYNDILEQLQVLEKNLNNTTNNIYERFDEYKDSNKLVLKDRLTQSIRFFLQKKEVNLLAKRNIMDLFAIYKKMGGNGFVEEMYFRFLQLPLIEDKQQPHNEDGDVEAETKENSIYLKGVTV